MLPASPAYFAYSGSATSPPCAQGVQWVVMANSVRMGEAQLRSLRDILRERGTPPGPESIPQGKAGGEEGGGEGS